MLNKGKAKALSLSVLVSFAFAGSVNAQVTDNDIVNDHLTTNEVVTNGLGLHGQRYSTLDTINTQTVEDIRPVWAFSLGGEKQRGQESQPMIKDGVMYITGSYSRVFAIDARTGYGNTKHDYPMASCLAVT
jgi:alcohol dehydrogenase (cytochrome c)